jgi:hypothetical protein
MLNVEPVLMLAIVAPVDGLVKSPFLKLTVALLAA